MAPWILVERHDLEGEQRRGRRRGRPARRRRRRVEPDRERIGAGDAEPGGRVVPADEHRLAAAPGQRPLGDRRRRAAASSCRRRSPTVSWSSTREVRGASASAGGHDRGAAGVERGAGRRRGRPATNVSRPSAARSAPTIAAPSVRDAVDGEVERRDRADPLHARLLRRGPRRRPRPRATGRIEVTRSVARHDLADPRARGGPGVLADAAERDDERRGRPRGHRGSGWCGCGRGRSWPGRAAPRARTAGGTAGRRCARGRAAGTARGASRRAGRRRPRGRAPRRRRRRRAARRAARRGPRRRRRPAASRSRARRAGAWSSRARRASTGEMREARMAGSIAAASVTATPVTSATRTELTDGAADSSVTRADRAAATRPSGPRATAPSARPSSDPRTPTTTAWTRMNRWTWPRVAPAARSSPTSRIRSTTVIESVLTMRNAPAKSAIAAISAVVDWKSAVEARRPSARSCGDVMT